MANRSRGRSEVLGNGTVNVFSHNGVDGQLPVDAPAAAGEQPNLDALAADVTAYAEDFKVNGWKLAFHRILCNNQGDPMSLADIRQSAILDTDPGEYGISFDGN